MQISAVQRVFGDARAKGHPGRTPVGRHKLFGLHRLQRADQALVVVYDEAVGIPADDVQRICDPFQRGSNVEGRINGTGIGLSSSRRIVERHRGRIEVNSIPGRGSAFTVYLPLNA